MVENQHILKVLRSAIHKLLYPFLVDITSHMCFNKKTPSGLAHIQEL
jgi:hypothetical protein